MSRTRSGLLIVSRVENLKNSLNAIRSKVNNLYIHLNVPSRSQDDGLPTVWSKVVSKIYADSYRISPEIDVKVLVTPLKKKTMNGPNVLSGHIDCLYSDGTIGNLAQLKDHYIINNEPVLLSDNSWEPLTANGNQDKVYKTVVLGGTFDRIHLGHKILLTEAVLRATKRLVVGVTDESMIKSKKLSEFILPVEKRIEDVVRFLNEIDSTLEYDVVPISDPFGPTKSDPDMEMIIVSKETEKGGLKVNEIRQKEGLSTLDIFSIELVESEECQNEVKECKVSSSNQRFDLLGTRLRPLIAKANLPQEPYIIGLTGGIGSGKSRICKRLAAMGAFTIDCDKVAHDIYEPGQVCYQRVVEAFGQEIVDPSNSKIDRKKLGPIVFGDPAKLQQLNGIVWPEIIREAKQRISTAYVKEGHQVFILEAAVLFLAGWESEVHEIWSTFVSKEEAIRRICERNSLSREDAEKRINSQLDNKTIIEKSDVVFSTEWSVEITDQQVEKAWQLIQNQLASKL